MAELKLIVGLGNPGKEYEGTRHNIGFEVLDALADEAGVRFELEKKWEGELAKVDGLPLLKPMTFMNLSGRSVASLARFYRWKPEEILVVYDDVALPLGRLRFREGGSDGGHNGIKSLIAHLGTRDFPRLRIGVGSARPGGLVGHVLGKFAPNEREEMQNTLARARVAVQLAASRGVVMAANEFNVKEKPKKQLSSDDEQEIRRSDCTEHQGEREEC
ncbi:MAG: aminoacyl-tRNA hydrolase [Verrucomicrobiota bacterium JB023]|nr:aminoacyl-tRNA hydrolase [Verrucomicrobiota bacterium JB023]